MRKTRHAVFGIVVALGAVGLPAVAVPAAHAGPDNYMEIRHHGAYVASTCYRWRGSDKQDYCHEGRTNPQSWKAYFPADATGATITLHAVAAGESVSTHVEDVNVNHCFELQGTTLNPRILETSC
jgi:hypothetical protein